MVCSPGVVDIPVDVEDGLVREGGGRDYYGLFEGWAGGGGGGGRGLT